MIADGTILKSYLIENSINMLGDVNQLNISSVFIDSRKQVSQSLFIPIVGDTFDGHEFLLQAIEKGAVGALWEKSKPLPDDLPSNFPIFIVDDTLKAMQRMAQYYVSMVNPIVIAITGSNGKTTTKDIVESVCKQVFHTNKTEGNLNNHIGLPLTILSMPMDCDVLILEMGMNHYGEISLLSNMARPQYAIVTNIGESHIEYLGSRDGIARAKLEIIDGFTDKSMLMIDGDEPLLTRRSEQVGTNVIKCGYDESNDIVISDVISDIDGYTFKINHNNIYKVPLLGKHNVKNASYAISLGEMLNLTQEQIQTGLDELSVTEMRLQTITCSDGTTIINDAYNASPTSMQAAIETLATLHGYNKKIAVLGDMYELGPDEESLHRKVASVIGEPISVIITVGSKAEWIANELMRLKKANTLTIHVCQSKEDVINFLKSYLGAGSLILFKASRAVKLETIVQRICS